MRKLKLFLGAKAANTPPRGISKASRVIFSVLTLLFLSIGQVWADEEVAYTLTVSSTGGNSSPHNSYTAAATPTINDIEWSVLGNSNQSPWRLGGKESNCSGVDRDVHSNTAISDNISKIEITHGTASSITVNSMTVVVSKNSDFSDPVSTLTPEFVAGGNVTVNRPAETDWSNCYYKFVYNLSVSGNSNRFVQFSGAVFYKESGGTPACAAPTFNPGAGAVASGTTVALSTTTEDATIHYTMGANPEDPTESDATYSTPIEITTATTIKAIAVKEGLNNSSVASASYTVLTPLTTMDEIFAAATSAGTTATTTAITFNNWVVTGVKNSNAYVTDGTKGFIIYTSSHGFQVGDILSGTAVCKVQLYNGSAELTELTASKVTVNTGGSVSPVVLDAEGIAALTGANTGSVIKISGECTYESSKYYIAGVQLYNQLYSFSVSAGTNYECTGVYVQYNTTKEILPRSAVDIVAQTSVANPTFSPVAGEYTEVQNVTLSCATDGATVYYTTDGTNPTNESTVYSSAIEVGASMTIKAIAYKGEDHSEVVSAAYTINIPLPEHSFQVTHHFSTGEGFEFPTGWGGSYAEHEIPYTDDKVHFASASKQSGTITDRPVVKEGAVSLILTNSHKLISAVRFDYSQWSDKVPTLTMKYSTDGGETYNNFDPVVSTTDFALQVLTMPEGVNAIQVVGTANKQTGLTSIAFDLVNKPIVTKTVTITTPEHGTLTVMNGEEAVASGDEIEVNSILTITATPAEGYKLTEVTVNGSAYTEETLTLTENVTIAATFEENLAPLVTSYDLSEIGVVTSHLNGERVGDKVNLPLTAASCSKVFRGWDKDANCAVAPEYAPGAEYTLEADNILYAVYADPSASATWNVATSLEAGDVVVISTNTGYTDHDMKTAGAISSSLFSCLASTYNADNSQITALAEGTLQFTVGGNATDGWTLKNGTKYLKVTAAKKVGLVDDEETWTISFSGNNATLAPKTGDYTGYSLLYNYNSGNDRFTAYNSAMTPISLYKQVASYENYSTDCQAAVATPTFSPVAGTYTEVQNVTISTETADATIYYTTNGDVPTTSSTLYEGAIEVAESKTIKAIAVKEGMANSAVATAAYTINLPLSTMDQIFAAATAAGTTATDVNIAFGNWVVSGVSTNAKNVFVTDGTKGLIIFDSGASMGFSVGDVLSGTVACKVQLYKGAAELTNLSSATEGLNIATGGSVTPEVKAISALSGINTGAPVTINSVQFDGEYLTDGVNSIKPFNSLFAYDDLENGKYYNVTGIYQQFDATKEILPRSAADIVEVNLEDPEISYTPASATIELGQSLPGTTFANPHELAISYNSNNEAVATVSNTGVIALGTATGTAVITASFAGDATYAAGNATYTITVTPASVSENVVIIAEYDSKFYALTNSISNKTAAAVEVEKDGDKIVVPSNEAKVAIQWTKRTSGEKTTFQDANDKYLKGVSNGGDLTVVDAVCNWSWNATDEYYYIGSRSFIYRESANGFKNYAVSNAGSSDYSTIAEVRVIDPANIVVTTKVDPELAFAPEEVTLTVGDAFVAPVLGYVEGFDGLADVTLESSNTNLAVVNEGVVSLVADAIGTATITATFDGNNNYLAGSASYTITVNEAGDDLSGTWVLASSVAAGDKIIIMGANNADIYTMGKQNPNNRAAVASTLSEDILNPGAATKVFTLVDAGEGKFAIQASNGNYLTSATSGTGNNLLEAANYENDNAKWTITIDGEGVASVVAAAGNRTYMKYNNGSTLFSCYQYETSQSPINLYKKGAPDYGSYQRTVTSGRYGTICLPKAGKLVSENVVLFEISYKESTDAVIYLDEVDPQAMEAGMPYIFFSNNTQVNVEYTSSVESSAKNKNGLYGTLAHMDDMSGAGIYMISNNQLLHFTSTASWLDENRAYIQMDEISTTEPTSTPGAAPRRRVAMTVNGEQVATGMDALDASEKPVKMVINGQLFILRGEKLYDATGRLVK